MAWTPRDIKDMVAQYPNRFKINGVSSTIEPDFGVVTEPGTPVNKALLQPIDNELLNIGNELLKINQVLLQETTVSASAQQISITPPAFTGYSHLKLIVKGTTNVSSVIYMRVNNDSTAGQYDYIMVGFSYSPGTRTYVDIGRSNGQFCLDFSMGNFVPSKLSGFCISHNNYNDAGSAYTIAYSVNISSLSSIQLFVESGKTINSGTKISIYGVKA